MRSSLTARAIALVVVLLMLTISYASSLRIYFAQAHDIATTRAEIADRQQRIEDLNEQMARWNDPAYVEAQARDRLGWVVPGETGFTVIGADGKPLGGGSRIQAEAGPPLAAGAWWDELLGSVEAADAPVPPKVMSAKEKPVTVGSKPAG